MTSRSARRIAPALAVALAALGGARVGAGQETTAGQEHEAHAPPPGAPAAPTAPGREACPVRDGGPGVVRVSARGGHGTVSAALDAAGRGDTVEVGPGVYRERLTIRCSMTLRGEAGAVLDGGGEGTVLRVLAPGAVVRGLTLRGSGENVSREDSGLLADGARGLVVEDVTVEDVLFGIYLKESPRAMIRGNRVEGKELPVNARGDGIRLWYSPGSRIEENRVRRARDVVIWFSDSVFVAGNEIRDGRYGLHYMYSDHNRFEDNSFEGNLVGAFLMYSVDLEFARNRFVRSAGASGIGLGLKDADRIRARENDFVDNAVGVFLDNSPRSLGVENFFSGNRLVGNDVGIRALPNTRSNRFTRNAFLDNAREVDVPGGGRATDNVWAGNYWSRYAGFDRDGDGVGDTPFVVNRLSDHLVSSNPRLAIFMFSPAAQAVDLLARILPFLEPRPVLVDPAPLLSRFRAAGLGKSAARGAPGAADATPNPSEGTP